MRRDRLEHGIQILKDLEASGIGDALNPEAEDILDMEMWGGAHSGHDCGTAACVGGYFTQDPHFQDEGLATASDLSPQLRYMPCFGEAIGIDALEVFFEISPAQARHIFSGCQTSLFNHAVERLQNVLDGLPDSLLADIAVGQRRQLDLLLEQNRPEDTL